ncbi:hypothetical protein LBMAG53_27340 [Planctomycetota bacterium]|nr:hypothetical protein LBMAG53_27340 [Planctomycetota bacterium]
MQYTKKLGVSGMQSLKLRRENEATRHDRSIYVPSGKLSAPVEQPVTIGITAKDRMIEPGEEGFQLIDDGDGEFRIADAADIHTGDQETARSGCGSLATDVAVEIQTQSVWKITCTKEINTDDRVR